MAVTLSFYLNVFFLSIPILFPSFGVVFCCQSFRTTPVETLQMFVLAPGKHLVIWCLSAVLVCWLCRFLVGAFYQNEPDYYSGKLFFLFFSSDHRMYA